MTNKEKFRAGHKFSVATGHPGVFYYHFGNHAILKCGSLGDVKFECMPIEYDLSDRVRCCVSLMSRIVSIDVNYADMDFDKLLY